MKKTNEQPEQSLREGDHLVSSRLGYDHYAIYVGGNAVIHYADFADGIGSDGEISLATLKEFRNGSDVQVELHPLGSLNRQTTVERAYSRLGENWYNVFLNNCEHFANWCVRGTHSSPHLNALIGKAALAYGMQGTRGKKTVQTVSVMLRRAPPAPPQAGSRIPCRPPAGRVQAPCWALGRWPPLALSRRLWPLLSAPATARKICTTGSNYSPTTQK